jgi:hypothetical protein
MVIKFTGGSENETVKKEQEQEEKEESKEGDDVDEGTSDKKPHKGAQPAVYELPVPELEKQIKVCRVRSCAVVCVSCVVCLLWSRGADARTEPGLGECHKGGPH